MSKRLMIFIGTLLRGGAERHLVQVLPRLCEEGFDICLVVFKRQYDENFYRLLEESRVKVIFLSQKSASALWKKLFFFPLECLKAAAAIRDFKPDIIHYFLPENYIKGRLASWLSFHRAKQVMSRRCLNDYQRRHRIIAKLEYLLHRTIHVALGNSKAVCQQLLQEGFSEEQVGLIYNGLPVEDYQRSMSEEDYQKQRAAYGVEPNDVLFVMVANFFYYKGHADLLHAIAQLTQQTEQPAFKVALAGRDGNCLQQMRQLAESLNIQDQLIWLGEVQAVKPILSLANVGLLVSHEEGFPNSVIEYMAASLPVIGTRAGGIAESVVHQKTGILVDIKNVQQLTEAMSCLLSKAQLRADYAAAANQRVRECFSLERCVAQYKTFYDQLLENNARSWCLTSKV